MKAETKKMFQFHKGAIKSFELSLLGKGCQCRFNSIKVRLKVIRRLEQYTRKARFNSIKVRLKEARRSSAVGRL